MLFYISHSLNKDNIPEKSMTYGVLNVRVYVYGQWWHIKYMNKDKNNYKMKEISFIFGLITLASCFSKAQKYMCEISFIDSYEFLQLESLFSHNEYTLKRLIRKICPVWKMVRFVFFSYIIYHLHSNEVNVEFDYIDKRF